METVLAAKTSVKKAAVQFNLQKSSLQNRISKIRKRSEIQIPAVLLKWRLPSEPRRFF
jgi:hypothetical protein